MRAKRPTRCFLFNPPKEWPHAEARSAIIRCSSFSNCVGYMVWPGFSGQFKKIRLTAFQSHPG